VAEPPEKLLFFPYAESLFEYAVDPEWTPDEDGFTLSLSLAATAGEVPDILEGVLTAGSGAFDSRQTRAVELRATPRTSGKDAGTATGEPPPVRMGLLKAILMGLVGGMILNLMPCVFPVISLKIMGFVQAAQGSRRKAVQHGLVFALGVLLSFWALALVIIGIKMGGKEVGWAFQFQEPRFVIFMAILFTLIALNMFGLFEMGTSLQRLGGRLGSGNEWAGSFFSGVLATLVATPCTGPFMAPVVGWALSQSGGVILTILTALGVGMSLPYVLLSLSPALMKRVPRPGPWMESFKQFLGFVLLAFSGIMAWVLGKQAGLDALTLLLAGLYLLAMGSWVMGRWGALHRPPRVQWTGRILGLLLIAGGILCALSYRPPLSAERLDPQTLAAIQARGEPVHYRDYTPEAAQRLEEAGIAVLWKPWSPAAVEALRAAGRPVFVDFTAAWCMICQANKAATHASSVEHAFADTGVAALEADWTKRDDLIRQELEAFDRSGVPLYLLYPPDGSPPRILPQNLTPRILLDALRDAGLEP